MPRDFQHDNSHRPPLPDSLISIVLPVFNEALVLARCSSRYARQ